MPAEVDSRRYLSLPMRCFFNSTSKHRLSATECSFKYEPTRTKQDV